MTEVAHVERRAYQDAKAECFACFIEKSNCTGLPASVVVVVVLGTSTDKYARGGQLMYPGA